MTIQKVTAFALVEQQQRWAQQVHRLDTEMAEWLDVPAFQRDRERMADLCLARDSAALSLWYWQCGVLRWMHVPAQA